MSLTKTDTRASVVNGDMLFNERDIWRRRHQGTKAGLTAKPIPPHALIGQGTTRAGAGKQNSGRDDRGENDRTHPVWKDWCWYELYRV